MTKTYGDHLVKLNQHLENHKDKLLNDLSDNKQLTEEHDIFIMIGDVQFSLVLTSSLYEDLTKLINDQNDEWGDTVVKETN